MEQSKKTAHLRVVASTIFVLVAVSGVSVMWPGIVSVFASYGGSVSVVSKPLPPPSDTGHSPVLIKGGPKNHLIGGRLPNGICSSNVLDIDTGLDTYIEESPLPTARDGLASARGNDGLIYAIGGNDCDGNVLGTIEAFDENGNVWTTGYPSLNTPRTGFKAVAGEDGLIFAIGGTDQNGNVLSSVEIYNPTTKTLSVGPSLHIARTDFAAALDPVADKIYVAGGKGSNGQDLNSVEILDLTTPSSAWSAGLSLPVPLSGLALVPAADHYFLYVVGGSSNGQLVDTIYRIDASNPNATWIQDGTTLPQPLRDAAVDEADNGNLLIGSALNTSGQPITDPIELVVGGDPSPHSDYLYLHGSEAAPEYGGLRMDNIPSNGAGVVGLNLLDGVSWYADPATSGTLSGSYTFSMPCSLGLNLGTTVTISSVNLEGQDEQQLAQASLPLICAGPVTVPLTGNSAVVQDRILKLTLQSGVSLRLNLQPDKNTFLLLNNLSTTSVE